MESEGNLLGVDRKLSQQRAVVVEQMCRPSEHGQPRDAPVGPVLCLRASRCRLCPLRSHPDIQHCARTWPPPLVPCCSRWQPREHWRQRNRLRARQCAPQCRAAANRAMPAALANQRHGRAISNLCIATNGVRHFEKGYVESRALQRPSCPRSCGRARLRCLVSSAANAYEKWRQGIACNSAADHRYVPFGRRCHLVRRICVLFLRTVYTFLLCSDTGQF